MVQLSERAEKLRQELAEKDGKDVADRYAEIEIAGKRPKPMKREPVITQAVINGRPVFCNSNLSRRPSKSSSQGSKAVQKENCPAGVDRNGFTCFAGSPMFKNSNFIKSDTLQNIIEVLEDPELMDSVSIDKGWLTVNEIQLALEKQNLRVFGDSRYFKYFCEYLRGIGYLVRRKHGQRAKRSQYRLTQEGDLAFPLGQMIIVSPFSDSARIGIVVEKQKHEVHPIDVLTVQWIKSSGEKKGVIGSDVAKPIMPWMEEQVCDWYKAPFAEITPIRKSIDRECRYKRLTLKDRVLESLKWQERVTIGQLSGLMNHHDLDAVLLQLERSDRIVILPGFPKTIALRR